MADAEYPIYLIRFNLEREELEAVFNETEIAKRFEEVMKQNEELVLNQMSAVRRVLPPLLKKDKQLETRALVFDERIVTLDEIKKDAKIIILNKAISKVLYKFSFDVKQNILEILNSSDEMKRILKKRVNYAFLVITNWRYEKELDKLL